MYRRTIRISLVPLLSRFLLDLSLSETERTLPNKHSGATQCGQSKQDVQLIQPECEVFSIYSFLSKLICQRFQCLICSCGGPIHIFL